MPIHPLILWGRAHGMNQGQTATYFRMSRPTFIKLCKGGLPQPKHMRILRRKSKGALTWEVFERFNERVQAK